jgi:G3E family GTPase
LALWWGGTRWAGADIYRSKGVLSIYGSDDKYVFQAVHMLFTGEAMEPWGQEPRVNKMVFIGKNLDREALNASFQACMVNKAKK